jgi:hypothetical protein
MQWVSQSIFTSVLSTEIEQNDAQDHVEVSSLSILLVELYLCNCNCDQNFHPYATLGPNYQRNYM